MKMGKRNQAYCALFALLTAAATVSAVASPEGDESGEPAPLA